ncbi:thiopurine S-methyltransferase [Ancylobacter sonchi]|uniref:thiopurine S-methyltransferase n=1 Tax=Ancylobacter sonchi TaxID=1937790 RepID=UPI001BD49BC7|nr:thiopurine S-methyltransferase [Ancylobacter sonchi]MBS7536658.1 thiopurine S-methyltransferase [Ancylobacter sonchi]
MDEEFWQGKWRRGEIAFHEADGNPLLRRYLPALHLPADSRLLLPLCGKTRDISWLLGQGYTIIGAELSRLAIEQLFAELGMVPHVTPAGPLERFEAGRLTVFVGNFFDLDRHVLGEVDAVYDRAALVALPEAMRARYAGHLVHLARAAPQLLIAFEYDQSQLVGPPFAVPEAEVRRHYGGAYHVTEAGRHELKDGLKGLKPAHEIVWLMRPR